MSNGAAASDVSLVKQLYGWHSPGAWSAGPGGYIPVNPEVEASVQRTEPVENYVTIHLTYKGSSTSILVYPPPGMDGYQLDEVLPDIRGLSWRDAGAQPLRRQLPRIAPDFHAKLSKERRPGGAWTD